MDIYPRVALDNLPLNREDSQAPSGMGLLRAAGRQIGRVRGKPLLLLSVDYPRGQVAVVRGVVVADPASMVVEAVQFLPAELVVESHPKELEVEFLLEEVAGESQSVQVAKESRSVGVAEGSLLVKSAEVQLARPCSLAVGPP